MAYTSIMQHTKLIIWDMDGVKYPGNTGIFTDYAHAVARAACELIAGLSPEDAHTIVQRSKLETGKSMALFVRDYGMDYLTLGQAAEQYLDISQLPVNPRLRELLEQIQVEHVILTEANPHWTNRILTHLQLADFYASRHVFTHKDYLHTFKADSTYPFELALQRTGHEAKHALMAEDTAKNLHFPKEMGMTTVLIDPNPHSKTNSMIDYVFRDATEFAEEFHKQHSSDPK